MRGARLKALAVVHHRLHPEGGDGARELFLLRLSPRQNGHRKAGLCKLFIDGEHLHRLLHRLLFGGVDGVALLPEEFARAEEGTGGLLPTHDVRPLVHEDGKIAVRLDPLAVHRADDGLRSRADAEGLCKLFPARVRDNGDFGRKAFDVLRLLRHERHGDKEREVSVFMPRLLEALVELFLDVFPDGVSVRADDHRALDGAVVDELGL